jgi:hypothetical protein
VSDDELPPDPFPPAPIVAPRVNRLSGALELAVEVIPLNIDRPDYAEWCDDCLLPSAVGYRFRILVNGRASSTRLALIVCRDCGTTKRRSS